MQFLSASESYLLGRRFRRLLRWAGLAVGLGLSGLGLWSITQDYHSTQRLAHDSSQQLTESLRHLSELTLEQTALSLSSLGKELLPADGAQHPLDAPALERLLEGAIRFDSVSQLLFARRGDLWVAVDRHGRVSAEALQRLRELPAPEVAGPLQLMPPIRLNEQAGELLPMLMRLHGAGSGQEWLLGALMPLAALHPPAPPQDNETPAPLGLLDQAVYLLDGQVLMHTGEPTLTDGRMAPESTLLARLASERPSGEFRTSTDQERELSGTFRRSGRFPLLVASLQADAQVLAPWRQRSATKLVMLALALLALGLGTRALQRMLQALARSESVYRRLFEDVADGVMVLDPAGRVLALNAAALRMTGRSQNEEVVGHALSDFFPHHIDPATGQPSDLPRQRMQRALAGEHLRFEYSFDAPLTQQRVDCEMRLSSFTLDGSPQLLCLVRDLSEERRFNRQQDYLANHDPLTGLPNRHNLLRRLDERIERHPDHRFELVFVNLARFKEINEAFGHRAADMVLEITARRLERQLLTQGWSLARAGGTDFVAVPPPPEAATTALPTETVCELMVQASREPITLGDTSVELHLKLGSAEYPGDAPDAGQLLRCADVAAARARTVVGSQVRYSRSFEQAPGHDLKMRSELSAAIKSGQLQLAWQPKLWLESRELEGVEALLRWHHPRLGWIPPSEFIPLAESTELIYPLTRWVISAALDQMALWQAQGQPLKAAVNISANNLQDPDFTDHIKGLLAQKNVPAQWLELEVTESALAVNPDLVLRRLQELRAAGLALALDDFGTGFSSLSYVSQFPFTSIKIDRSFVSALLRSPRDRHVAESTIALGRKLGLRTVAEGVEDDSTAAALMALDCDVGQGYLFAKPLMGQAFEQWRLTHQSKLLAARRQAAGQHR
ncbi:MAG: phosphodiesterase [Curvibacter sp.]|nr:MAG: phosphodiesterase [Curvibacter sp.]